MLERKLVLLFVLGAAAAMSGCSHDTLVDGPFMPGREPVAVHDGKCSERGQVKDQDARRNDWTVCKELPDFPTESVQFPSDPSSQYPAPQPMRPAPSQHRSAWD